MASHVTRSFSWYIQAVHELVYGSIVRDLDDYHVLDLDTFAWLPLPPDQSRYAPGRGGVQSVIPLENNEGWLMLGNNISAVNLKYIVLFRFFCCCTYVRRWHALRSRVRYAYI